MSDRRDDKDDREQQSPCDHCVLHVPSAHRLVMTGAKLIKAAFIWPWPLPQNSEQAISNRPGGGAVNSTITGSPPFGIRTSIFSFGIEKPWTVSFDRITSRTGSPVVT